MPVAIERAESHPILPPRPTGRAVPAQESSIWRSWPVVVIIIAVLAIAAAITLMVWPTGQADAGKHALQPPPAPEHMETDPLPPPPQHNGGAGDPWNAPHTQADPRPAPNPVNPPEPPDPSDDPDLDPFSGGGVVGGAGGGGVVGGVGGGGVVGGGGGGMTGGFAFTAIDHACRKLKSCPDVDQTMLAMTCDLVGSMPKRPTPSCIAARRCLEAIDHMSCSKTGFASPMLVISLFQDCTTATTSC
ncbi:MAG: hypothetical protein JWO36_6463 [Myxococcales bacterium]|nr:hypothetical protein [Myxococcales bacterium]